MPAPETWTAWADIAAETDADVDDTVLLSGDATIEVQNLGVMRVYAVADATARDAAFATPAKGQIVLLDSTKAICLWDGTQWQQIESNFSEAEP